MFVHASTPLLHRNSYPACHSIRSSAVTFLHCLPWLGSHQAPFFSDASSIYRSLQLYSYSLWYNSPRYFILFGCDCVRQSCPFCYAVQTGQMQSAHRWKAVQRHHRNCQSWRSNKSMHQPQTRLLYSRSSLLPAMTALIILSEQFVTVLQVDD